MKHDRELQAGVERQWQREYEDHIGEPRPKKRRRTRIDPDEPTRETEALEWGGVEPIEQTQ